MFDVEGVSGANLFRFFGEFGFDFARCNRRRLLVGDAVFGFDFDVVVAIDVSRSMLAQDVRPNRLVAAMKMAMAIKIRFILLSL